MVRNNPTFFLAVVPVVSSNLTSNSAAGLASTKIWYFYGNRDVSATNRIALINAIKNAGGDTQITAINGSHAITKQVYLDYKMIDWMLC